MGRSRAASHGAWRANNSRSAVSSPPATAAISSSSSIASLLRSDGNRFTHAGNYGNTVRGLRVDCGAGWLRQPLQPPPEVAVPVQDGSGQGGSGCAAGLFAVPGITTNLQTP